MNILAKQFTKYQVLAPLWICCVLVNFYHHLNIGLNCINN